ncbi:hypothetical protein [Tetragenococcus solitarius]|uniref:Uncharacterized protein n=2 Tax=Tetragenococcus solitarius TaxID=71453 RepID=A0ABN3Y2T0_9ENTE
MNKSRADSTSMKETSTISSSKKESDIKNKQAQNNDTSSESDEKTFSQLDEIIGVWINEEKEQTFAITSHDYIADDKKYLITGVDVNEEEKTDKYVISWDTNLFIKEYGKPKSFNPQPFIYDYNSEQDTLSNLVTFHRKIDDKQVNYIKDKLAGNEPINLEQLLQVDDQYLLAYWNKAAAETDNLEKQLATVYQEISIDFPDLQLLTDKEYEKYQSIAKEIEDNSDYSFSDLNTALPQDIYHWYIDLDKDISQKERIKQLLPKIKKSREQYFKREKRSDQPYLENTNETEDVDNTKENNKSKETNENDPNVPDEKMQKHIRKKIKEDFSEDIPKDHIVYDMELKDTQVNIRVYENQESKLQYQVSFVYNIEKDELKKQQ